MNRRNLSLVFFAFFAAASLAHAGLIVDINPDNSAPNIATAADFIANDAALAGTPLSTHTSGNAWAGQVYSFDGLTLTTGGGRGNARGGNAAAGWTTNQPILGGSVLTNGTDPLLTLDIAGLAALNPGTNVLFTIYGVGDNIDQETAFNSTFAGVTTTQETVFNTNPADPNDVTGAVPFVQFSYTADGTSDTIGVVSGLPSNGNSPRTFLNGWSVSVVPEPNSLALGLLGSLALLAIRRRK